LLEAYSEEQGRKPLALDLKTELYAREPDPNHLDAYVMIYRRLESYLRSRGQNQRLELVRRCPYFKVNKLLTRVPVSGSRSWQRQLLETLVKEWQWVPYQLHSLDSRRYWKVSEVLSERSLL